MPWTRPTLTQLVDRISADLSGQLLDGGNLLSRSVLRVLATTWAGACHLLYGFLSWMFAQVFFDSSEGAFLERQARIWAVTRRPGSHATGTVRVSGALGALVPAGAVARDALGRLYQVLEDTPLQGITKAGIATVTTRVQAVDIGESGNLAHGELLNLVSPYPGVAMELTVGENGLSAGANEEADASLRVRLLSKIQSPPHGGNAADYVQWALQVPGVTRAWCYPLWLGIGTVGVTVVNDNAPASDPTRPLPGPELVSLVQAHLDVQRPVTAALVVFAPEKLLVDVALLFTPDTEAVRERIRLELADLFVREGAPGVRIPLSHLNESISITPGEFDHVLTLPIADVSPAPNQLPVLGTVTFGAVS